jgi:hypothetical protein
MCRVIIAHQAMLVILTNKRTPVIFESHIQELDPML